MRQPTHQAGRPGEGDLSETIPSCAGTQPSCCSVRVALRYPFEEGLAFEGGMQVNKVDGIGQKQLHPSVAEMLKRNKAQAVEASHVKSALRKAGRPDEDEESLPDQMDIFPSMFAGLFGSWRSSGMLLQTQAGSSLVALRERGEVLTWRESLYLVLNEPASGAAAFWFGRLMQVFLVGSALSSTYETVTSVNQATGPGLWIQIKIGFNLLFTAEMLVRIFTFIPFRSALRSGYVWLDILTVLPLYLRMMLYPSSMEEANYLTKAGAGITIRVVDSFVAFRILKLCRYFEGAEILARAVGKSMAQLYVPLFMLLLMVYCFAAVIFEIEFDSVISDCVLLWEKEGIAYSFLKSYPDGVGWDCSTCETKEECNYKDDACIADYEMKCKTCNGFPDGHPECNGVSWGQTFPDIPRSMWFTFVTVSTVGYGDVSPTSWQGQIFVCFVIVAGLIFLAMPLAIVGSTFGVVWDERQVTKLQKHLRQLLAENGIDPSSASQAFEKMDASGDGNIALDEFKGFCQMYKLTLNEDEIQKVWKALDSDNSGSMSQQEFIDKVYPGTDLSTVEGLVVKNKEEEKKLKKMKAMDADAQRAANHNEVIAALTEQRSRTEALEEQMTELTRMHQQLETVLRDVKGALDKSAETPLRERGRSKSHKVALMRSATTDSMDDREDRFHDRVASKGKPGRSGRRAHPERSATNDKMRSKGVASLPRHMRSPVLSSAGNSDAEGITA